MPSADHDATNDDEIARYVAAFRAVEQPSAASRDASWRAIAAQTSEPRRLWLWVAGAATLLAAGWILWSAGAVQQLFTDGREAVPDQAGYLPSDGDAPLPVDSRSAVKREPAVADAPVADAPVADAPVADAPVVDTPVATSVEHDKPRTKKRDDKPAPSLAEETALFGEIQQALVAGDPRRALAAIARHERTFPRGAFEQERVVAKAQALCAAGKGEAARALRERFLARNPSSHLAARMRAVCPG